MASTEEPGLAEAGRAAVGQFDGTGLAIGTLVITVVAVSAALWVWSVPSIGAAAAAYGFAFALTILIVYVVELVGRGFGWQFLDRFNSGHLPRWWGSPVLPLAAVILGLLFGHFIW